MTNSVLLWRSDVWSSGAKLLNLGLSGDSGNQRQPSKVETKKLSFRHPLTRWCVHVSSERVSHGREASMSDGVRTSVLLWRCHFWSSVANHLKLGLSVDDGNQRQPSKAETKTRSVRHPPCRRCVHVSAERVSHRRDRHRCGKVCCYGELISGVLLQTT